MNTDNLKTIRKKSGKTQKEVAEGIGIGQGTYKNYETGAREPNNATLVAIANYFNVTTDYLLGREEQTPDEPVNLDKIKEYIEIIEEQVNAIKGALKK